MIKRCKNYFIPVLFLFSIQAFLMFFIIRCIPFLKDHPISQTSNSIDETNRNYPNEKRAYPTYDKIIGKDGLPHYRVLFWVPKEAIKFTPYADTGVKTDVSSHGSVEKWFVGELKTNSTHEKLVFIFVPKTFVYLYGNGFEKVIHLKYS